MMAQALSATSVFCEDIREEVGGSTTVVGVMPDNLEVPSFPGMIPKLGIYTRLVIDLDASLEDIDLLVRRPSDDDIRIATFSKELIASAVEDAKRLGTPIVGLVSHAIASPFPMNQAERVIIVVSFNGTEIISGSLNVTAPSQSASAG